MIRCVFVGNRRFVIDEMLDLNLHIVEILVVKGSCLSKVLDLRNIKYSIVSSKKELVKKLESLNFDILISNGCPFETAPVY